VVAVLASEPGCDRVADLLDAYRVSATEVMLVGEASVAVLERAVRAEDGDAVVLEVSDGWAVVPLEGPGAVEAFTRLSELPLPAEGFVQGEVARIGARVIVRQGGIDLLVPAMLEAHVRERVRVDCAGLLP
jgi:glycine cleavage system aminomethyltransferase T